LSQLLRLDLGCGSNKKEGFIGVDNSEECIPDVLCDLGKDKWPWDSGTVDEVYSSHFLEHLTGEQRLHFFAELHRVLKPGAQAFIQVPYYSSMRAAQDPTHQWPPICEASFLYVNAEWRKANKIDHYIDDSIDFDFTYGYIFDPAWEARNHEAKLFAAKHYINVVHDLVVTLIKRAP